MVCLLLIAVEPVLLYNNKLRRNRDHKGDIMSKPAEINKDFLKKIALVVVAALIVSLLAGFAFGNRKTGQTPKPSSNTADNTNTANNANNTNNSGGTIINTSELVKKAASMQDYTIDPTTGMAKEIKVVDDNYLLLVNRTHPLAQDYVPDDMVKVDSVVSGVGVAGETDHLRKAAAEAFEEMVKAAKEAEIEILMRTGYRSYEYQRDRLYEPTVKSNGQAYADTVSAKPGQSEHQTGLALDVGGKSENYALSYNFGDTPEGKWVADHCYEYGFIIRYIDGTKDKPGETTGFIFEPWHLRYVGKEAAKEIKDSGGKLLEEYLGILN